MARTRDYLTTDHGALPTPGDLARVIQAAEAITRHAVGQSPP
jgi:hypothetical protein